MTAIPDDVLDIAAVVTGGESLPLTDWQRHLAIQAMHALGCSVERMQEALQVTRRWHLAQIARRAGVDIYAVGQLDELAVEFACQGTPMHLGNPERDEVIRRVGYRHSAAELGRLCGQPTGAVSAAASRLGVKLRKPHEAAWWHRYEAPRRDRETVAA